jgi:hypothetical protein
MLARLLLVLAACLPAAVHAQACGSRLFVSGFHSTVHVFDACTGAFLQNLDTPTRLAGAMAVRLGPDGFLYAVAEIAGTIHKYRNDTLEYAGLFANVGPIGATGLAFDAAGIAHVAGYNTDDVKRYDRTGAALGAAFPARAAGLNGPDSGMTFGPDGNLYIPGYDSNSVVRWDPRTGETGVAVAARTAGLARTRGLLPMADGQHMLVTSEGSGQLLKWHLGSGAVTELARGFAVPTGVAHAPGGELLVANGDGVERVDPATGERLGTFIAPNAGGISGQVFLAVIEKPAAAVVVDRAQVGSQYWVVGDARFDGARLVMPEVYSAAGTAFGPALARSEIAVKRWGTVTLEVTSCTRARFSWDATGAGSAGFGAGSYDVERFFENGATARCMAQGIDHPDRSWVNGQWWGGPARSGEGLFVDRRADGTAFFAWFTHRPAEALAAVDRSQVGSQYWIVGDARFEGRVLDIAGAYSATGTTFGPTLSRSEIAIKRWGRVRLELVSCTEARFAWDSTGADSAGFGAGGYTVTRFFENEDTARCRAQGVDHADRSWAAGQWWGGEARSGEGIFLDVRADGTAFFAWFTHRPR